MSGQQAPTATGGADKFRVVRGRIVTDVLKDEFDGLLHAFA